jgi:hypothetical protein
MSKAYWTERPDGAWEFLGAFLEDHEPDPGTPQARGSAILFDGLDVRQTYAAMRKRTLLVGIPNAIRKALMTSRVMSIGFDQVDGYLQ